MRPLPNAKRNATIAHTLHRRSFSRTSVVLIPVNLSCVIRERGFRFRVDPPPSSSLRFQPKIILPPGAAKDRWLHSEDSDGDHALIQVRKGASLNARASRFHGSSCTQTVYPRCLDLGSIPTRAAIRRAVQARLAHGLRPINTAELNALIPEARRMSLSKGQRPASQDNRQKDRQYIHPWSRLIFFKLLMFGL